MRASSPGEASKPTSRTISPLPQKRPGVDRDARTFAVNSLPRQARKAGTNWTRIRRPCVLCLQAKLLGGRGGCANAASFSILISRLFRRSSTDSCHARACKSSVICALTLSKGSVPISSARKM